MGDHCCCCWGGGGAPGGGVAEAGGGPSTSAGAGSAGSAAAGALARGSFGMRIHHACGCLGSFNELLGVALCSSVVDASDSARDDLLLDAGPSDSNGGAPDSSGAPGGKLFDSSLTETLAEAARWTFAAPRPRH